VYSAKIESENCNFKAKCRDMEIGMKVKLVRSPNGCSPNQKKNLKALGLHKINQEREHSKDNTIIGKIKKVKHLVEVKE